MIPEIRNNLGHPIIRDAKSRVASDDFCLNSLHSQWLGSRRGGFETRPYLLASAWPFGDFVRSGL